MKVKFKVEEFLKSARAHRYRFAIVRGKVSTVSEGYPTAAHVFRAVKAIHEGYCKMVDPEQKLQWPMPVYTKDSLMPKEARVAAS